MPRRLRMVGIAALLLAAGVWGWTEFAAWRVEALAAALRRVPAQRIAFCACRPDSSVTFQRDGLRLVADLYRRADSPGPSLLLLHGLTPRGEDLPLYHVLGRRLADAGFVVLALDFAGFGRSDDPYRLGTDSALDGRRDVAAAIAALERLPGATGPVTVVGHSMGAIEAMEAGLADPRVGAVVALGPPRRTAEVLANEAGRSYHWNRIRATYDSVYHRPLPDWFTRERFLVLKAHRDIERFAPDWAGEAHVPLLLLDGAREAPGDRDYLRRYAERAGGRTRYVTIPAADHYLNSGAIGGLLYYDRAAVDSVVKEITAWRPVRPAAARGPEPGAPR